ncbi:Neuronal pentraxin-2 [Exaiptasia diaphana]|nr:Neuronal pentraxin-2 [Exaiptasia diaphana]
MTSLTVCLWMIAPVYNQIDHRTMISYAVPGTDNEILLDNPESLLFWIGSSQWETKVSTNDGNWHHICATWDNSYGQTELYQDGVRRARGMYLKKGYETKASGSLIIGQEQDRVGGGFVESQSYVGEMTEINIWNRVLWEIEIAEMSKTCTSDAPGKVLTWDDVKAGIRHGEVAIVPSLCKP